MFNISPLFPFIELCKNYFSEMVTFSTYLVATSDALYITYHRLVSSYMFQAPPSTTGEEITPGICLFVIRLLFFIIIGSGDHLLLVSVQLFRLIGCFIKCC